MPPGNMFGCDCSSRDSNPDPTFRKNVALPFELHGYFNVSNIRIILSFLKQCGESVVNRLPLSFLFIGFIMQAIRRRRLLCFGMSRDL